MQKEFYFNSKAQSDSWDRIWAARTIEQELEACEIESPPRELFKAYLTQEDRIIDAGCGFGKWVVYLKQRGYNILGIDNNKLAVAKLMEYDNSLKVELGDILNIHYPDNSFDAYISMGVIEHFEDGPLPALKEAHRVLKPNGLIFVSAPTVNILRSIIRRPIRNAINTFPISLMILKENWRKSKSTAVAGAIGNLLPERIKVILLNKENRFYHFTEYRYSKAELEGFLKQCGFEVVKTVPHDFYDSKKHSAGLISDFPFLGNWVNSELNLFGRLTLLLLNVISPRIACSSVLCLGRAVKGING